MKRTETPYIIEGTLTYIPRVTGLDKFNRHTITIIPDDQSIIEELAEHRQRLLTWREEKHNIGAEHTPHNASWKLIGNTGVYGIGVNWSDKEIESGDIAITDEDDAIYDVKYSDMQLKQARVKCSFELWSYCFTKESGTMVYGTKCKLRKLRIMSLASFDTLVNHNHEDAIGGDVSKDF